jgi:signal transduction histidine kinase
LEALDGAAAIVDARGQVVASTQAMSALWDADLPKEVRAAIERVRDSDVAETVQLPAPSGEGHGCQIRVAPLDDVQGGGGWALIEAEGAGTARSGSYQQLVGALAHELRTPLTAIIGHADILKSCDPLHEENLWQRSRSFIASEAERLARLVEDLLILYRLDLGPPALAPVNIRAVAETALSALYQIAEQRQVRLSLQCSPRLPRVRGDRDRLERVLINLLDNAIKYAPRGGRAEVRLTDRQERVEVCVCNDGDGIAPEDLPHVFDPLYRGGNAGHAPGTGLGLTIVRAILEQHSTEIEVQSDPGSETTFTFCLSRA